MPLDDPRLQRAIRDHMGMAQSIAWRYIRRLPPGVDVDEILSVAHEALCQAGAKWIGYCEARGYSPWSEDDPDQPEAHFGGYVAKTVNGRILDWARSQDYVTRQTRAALKQLHEAEEDGARTEAGLSAATGLTAAQIRKAQTAEGTKPCSLDDHLEGAGANYGDTLCDDRAGVESEASVRETLAAAVAAFDALPAETQVILALWYHAELEPAVIAKELRTSEQRVMQLHDAGVQAVHQALLQNVQVEGTAPRRPAPPLPPVRIRSGDCCYAGEAGARVKRCADCLRQLPVEAFSWRDQRKGYRVPYCPPCASGRAAAAYVKRKAARAVVR